eukprot:5859674-Alexandrium_andersonii.AAC.1
MTRRASRLGQVATAAGERGSQGGLSDATKLMLRSSPPAPTRVGEWMPDRRRVQAGHCLMSAAHSGIMRSDSGASCCGPERLNRFGHGGGTSGLRHLLASGHVLEPQVVRIESRSEGSEKLRAALTDFQEIIWGVVGSSGRAATGHQ